MADRDAWTALPELPRRYRLRDRWLDYRRGHADARKGIPLVLVRHQPAVAEIPTDTPGDRQFPQEREIRAGASDPAEEAMALVTPYMDGLRHMCNEALAAEYGRYHDACAQLREVLRNAQTRRAPLAAARDVAAARFSMVEKPLTDEEAGQRRTAEQEWSPEMVRVRRSRERAAARFTAEEALLAAESALRIADVAVDHAQTAFGNRRNVMHAAGWLIFHHYGRREATYLGALARKHKQGPELVRLLRLTGPDLPDWLLPANDPKEDEA